MFTEAWEILEPGSWVLEVIRRGYKIEFTSTPPVQGNFKETPIPKDPDQRRALELELSELMLKNAINVVPDGQRVALVHSTFFLTRKKGNLWRPILNLKSINKRFIRPKGFRMETLASIIPLLEKGMWATTIDLKDAYLHIAIHPEHRRYLAFRYQEVDYQFRVLPFGLSTAPRVFTRVTRTIVAFLRRQGISIFSYIDDWLVVSGSEERARRDTAITVSLLEDLGWLINREKSNLTPQQSQTYLGARLNMQIGRAFPTELRVERMIQLSSKLMFAHEATARTWLQLLGNMASLVEILDLCRLRMRPLQVHLLSHYNPRTDPMTKVIPVPEEMVPFLAWWATRGNVDSGRLFKDDRPETTLTTDASLLGWGATWKNLVVQGSWSAEDAEVHINVLETEAVTKAINHWSKQLQGHRVTVMSDNSTTVAYINHQGGTRSRPLLERIWELLIRCEVLGISLRASHLAGKDNTVADALSRGTFRRTEWCLLQSSANHVFEMYDRPQVDLFATAENARLPTFCSRQFNQRAWRVDAFSFPWMGIYLYAFPPWGLIERVLLRVRGTNTEMILVAPCWPNLPWFPLLLNLLVDLPFQFPTDNRRLLSQRSGSVWHRDLNSLHLSAWRISGSAYRQREFHQRLLTLQSMPGGVPRLEFTTPDWRPSSSGQLLTMLIPWKLR